jgi:hypothetical protein
VRFFRTLCLGCFCILGLAVVVAIFEAAALDFVLNITGCKSNPEILPNFTCGDGLVRSSIELVLNLPLVFVYAPAFTFFFRDHPPSRTFMLLLYSFDIILVLALTYPLLVFLARKRAKRGG